MRNFNLVENLRSEHRRTVRATDRVLVVRARRLLFELVVFLLLIERQFEIE